ncbi:hypothetical protein LguiA_031964 [Lonicera macranthoides]
MHVTKGGWVGQTFALAKLNDSGGKKTRIRRSKEERKTMVESFIKKYQNLNNGSFPSLNLTHKEVGGSFYTVRELVREIIQENRVLGPAKLTPEDNDTDMFSQQYPLGSISVEPQIHVESSDETHTIIHVLPYHYEDSSEELALNSSGKIVNGSTVRTYTKEESKQPISIESQTCLEGEKELEASNAKISQNTTDIAVVAHQQRLDNGKFVNWSIVETERKEELDHPVNIESQMCLEGERDVKNVSQMKTDIVVETFPLRPVSKTTASDEKLEDKESENFELDAGTVLTDSLEISSSLMDEKVEANVADSLSKRILVDEKIDTSLESSNGSATKVTVAVDVIRGADIEVEEGLPTGNQPKNAPNDVHVENLNNTNTHDSHGQSIYEETVETKNEKPQIQHGDGPRKIRDPTLDRINLSESWEATSKKSGGTETNPLLELLKAIVAAFVKFWSE